MFPHSQLLVALTIFLARMADVSLGTVQLLFVQVRRREVRKICGLSRIADPRCYLVVDDIRDASYGNPQIGK